MALPSGIKLAGDPTLRSNIVSVSHPTIIRVTVSSATDEKALAALFKDIAKRPALAKSEEVTHVRMIDRERDYSQRGLYLFTYDVEVAPRH